MDDRESLQVRIRQMGEIGFLHAKGSVDLKTLPGVRDAIRDLLAKRAKHLILDFTGVTYIDSAGITSIMTAKRGVSAREGEVFVATRTNEVQLALRIVQIDRVVQMVDSVEEALEALLPPSSASEPPV
ncbi:MAG: STAS domain-containing protein [Armatimonadetes bacterium]|nr:STAS domain-containing protein [Armatimonadota bacterium]